MGMCKPSGGIQSLYGKRGSNIKSNTGSPNTRTDLYNEETGELIQQRWYGPDGRAIWDRDWSHGGVGHEWPHDHYWDWTNELHPDRLAYSGPNGKKTNLDYC